MLFEVEEKVDKKITISDIADALGVSKTTVSRAISGKGRIGKETKAKKEVKRKKESEPKGNSGAARVSVRRTRR